LARICHRITLRLHVACRIIKATDTHSEYAKQTGFPRKKMLHKISYYSSRCVNGYQVVGISSVEHTIRLLGNKWCVRLN